MSLVEIDKRNTGVCSEEEFDRVLRSFQKDYCDRLWGTHQESQAVCVWLVKSGWSRKRIAEKINRKVGRVGQLLPFGEFLISCGNHGITVPSGLGENEFSEHLKATANQGLGKEERSEVIRIRLGMQTQTDEISILSSVDGEVTSVVTESVVTESVVTESVVTESVVTESVVTESVVTESVVTESVVTESVVTESTANTNNNGATITNSIVIDLISDGKWRNYFQITKSVKAAGHDRVTEEQVKKCIDNIVCKGRKGYVIENKETEGIPYFRVRKIPAGDMEPVVTRLRIKDFFDAVMPLFREAKKLTNQSELTISPQAIAYRLVLIERLFDEFVDEVKTK